MQPSNLHGQPPTLGVPLALSIVGELVGGTASYMG